MSKKDLWVWSAFFFLFLRDRLSTAVIQLQRNPLNRHVKFMRNRRLSSLEPSQRVHSYGFLVCLITEGVSVRLLLFVRSCADVISHPSAGPSLLRDGVCEWRRSNVPHPENQEVWGAQSTFLHCWDHVCSHVPAWQRHSLQVWITNKRYLERSVKLKIPPKSLNCEDFEFEQVQIGIITNNRNRS